MEEAHKETRCDQNTRETTDIINRPLPYNSHNKQTKPLK